MFVDFSDQTPPPPPWEPGGKPRRITKRQEKLLGWVLLVNALLLLFAPLGGATLIQGIVALFRG